MHPEPACRVLITGASGNLGGMFARHLQAAGAPLRLMIHRRPVPRDLADVPGVETVSADLGDPDSLPVAVSAIHTVVHFAGVLFAPRPRRFLPTANVTWFENLVSASLAAGVSKIILISFPHVEGETSSASPATGRLTAVPRSLHARTRLEAEKLLLAAAEGTAVVPVVLRLGMIYGRGVTMIEAARWLARRRLLAVWRKPTWVHLLAKEDFLRATHAAVVKPGVRGIYHVGDDSPITLQDFLDRVCMHWDLPRPWRLPLWLIYTAAGLCELAAMTARKPSPLTRDFITIGRQSYCGDTSRTKSDLVSDLSYPDLQGGLEIL